MSSFVSLFNLLPIFNLLLERIDFSYPDSALYFAQKLRQWGVEDRLRKHGAADGDTVWIGDRAFVLGEALTE